MNELIKFGISWFLSYIIHKAEKKYIEKKQGRRKKEYVIEELVKYAKINKLEIDEKDPKLLNKIDVLVEELINNKL